MGKRKNDKSMTPEIVNRKARHDYHIESTIECGVALAGSEVKAVREGNVSIGEGYARVDERTNELWLHNVHISEYGPARGSANAHRPTAARKLLAHKREIRKLAQETLPKGVTLIPLKIYFKNGWAKVLIGVARGKTHGDKRQDNRKREADREIRRAMTRKRIG
ncbi:MAG: SsrA-binding protein SmpB [Phycisphaerales bacterium]